MPQNIEIKARVHDLAVLVAKVKKLTDRDPEYLIQYDTFFNSPKGRLKLREFSASCGQLIYYERPDMEGPKNSYYQIYHTKQPENLRKLLGSCLGVRGVIKKNRSVYWQGPTRIHCDKVESLGDFLELEVVLKSEQDKSNGIERARMLMQHLNVSKQDLVSKAYIDLLEEKNYAKSS